jgi:hypothetical protein
LFRFKEQSIIFKEKEGSCMKNLTKERTGAFKKTSAAALS